MASFMSPDWQTTCAYTYRPPNITPGYTGYAPQQRFGYGDTFGNATAERFQARRNELLLSSNVDTEKEYRPPIVKFPTVNSNDPALVLANRKRSQERWLASEKYVRSNERTKERELQEYLKRCQHHREHYSDRTGTVKRVEEFVLPRLIPARLQQNPISMNSSQPTVYEDVKQNTPARNFRGTFRERAIRDQFFETR